MSSVVMTGIGELATQAEQGLLTDAAVVIEGERLAWVGPAAQAPAADERVDLGGRAVIPGFVDSHAVIDLFEEMRAVELDERLATEQRGHWSAGELLTAATVTGHASLGWADAGRIAAGQRADLVTLATSSPRTAGTGSDEASVVFAATGEDVVQVIVDGKIVIRPGDRHDVGQELAAAIGKVGA